MKTKPTPCLLAFFMICIISQTGLCSGWNDYAIRLPNGYRLVRTNAPSIFIFRPEKPNDSGSEKSCTVPPKIIRLNVYEDIVFGETEYSPNADDWGRGVSGFFILDTKNHKVRLGLDRDTWLNSLKEFGVSIDPVLRKPSRFLMLKIRAYSFRKWVPLFVIPLLLLLGSGSFWHMFRKSRMSRNKGQPQAEVQT